MRLIDADALKANINGWYRFMTEIGHAPKFTLGQEDIIAKIDNQPTQQQPCEDAVSRKEVADIINRQRFGIHKISMGIIKEKLEALPSVTPIRRKGEWKYDKTIQNWRCSKCNETPKTLGYVGTKEFMTEHFKFCNHCGADMRGEKDAT